MNIVNIRCVLCIIMNIMLYTKYYFYGYIFANDVIKTIVASNINVVGFFKRFCKVLYLSSGKFVTQDSPDLSLK